MQGTSTSLIEQIDALLESGDLDEQTSERLVEMLTPGASDPWPDIESVLHLAEHPAIADDLRMHRVPDELEDAIGEALEAVLPLLGIRPYGPTFKIAESARRQLEAETKKYDMVVAKLQEVGEAEREVFVARYLDTEPAPMFTNRLERLFPQLVERVRADADGRFDDRLAGLEALGGRILQAYQSTEPDLVELLESLEGFDERVDLVAGEALASENRETRLGGAALMCVHDLRDLLPAAFRRVFEGEKPALWLAVLAAKTSPERARSAFSTFVAEATLQNPDLPEAELTEQRIRALLSTRSLLPKVGSPMEEMTVEEVPELVEDDELREIPRRADEIWNFVDCLLRCAD